MTREPAARLHSDRRKEVRHTVELKGMLHSGGKKFPLEVGDLSASGGLMLMKGSPSIGTMAELRLEGYGPIALKVMHSGAYFCGVAFADPAAHRLRLQHWPGAAIAPQTTHTETGAQPLAAD